MSRAPARIEGSLGRRNLAAVGVEEHDVLVRLELILHLAVIADDHDDRVLGAEQRRRAALDLLRRERGDLADERLRIILRQTEDVDRVENLRQTGLRRSLDWKNSAQVGLRALQLRPAAALHPKLVDFLEDLGERG